MMQKKPLVFFIVVFLSVQNCFAQAFDYLKSIEGVNDIHNCQVEVLVNDCETGSFECVRSANIFIHDERTGKNGETTLVFDEHTEQWALDNLVNVTNNYYVNEKRYQNYLKLQWDTFDRIILLEIGELNLTDWTWKRQLECKPSFYGRTRERRG